MKKPLLRVSLLVLWAICFLSLEVSASTRNCPEEMAGYWQLDETTAGTYRDRITETDAECAGVCPTPLADAVVNSGQRFNADGSIQIDDAAAFDWLGSDSFTIELWIQRNTGFVSGGLEVFVGRADATGLSWYIGINGDGRAQAKLTASGGSGPSAVLVGTRDLRSLSTDPTWHHVALVRNGQTALTTLYVNGEAVATQTFTYTADFFSDTAPVTLGSWNGLNNRFNGALDEVAVYRQALSANTVKRHYYLARGYCSFYDEPVRIMPLGDSITAGVFSDTLPPVNERVGYRLPLWDFLSNNLFWSDFIGSLANGAAIAPDFDQDHAGFPGMRDDQLVTLLTTGQNLVLPPNNGGGTSPDPYLDVYPAEVILLHIGTNGLESSSLDVEAVLDQIDAFSKNVTVLLARIINRSSDSDPNNRLLTTQFNNNVAAMAAGRIAQGDKIIMLNMETGAGINYAIDTTAPYSGDMYDFLHPNPSGYDKMAINWYGELETILPRSRTPQILSSAAVAQLDQPFVFSVDTTGRPWPDFSLLGTPPDGMIIDAQSGEISGWTPTALDDQTIRVRAENWAGFAQRDISISVNARPEALGNAYGGIAQGGTVEVNAAQGVLSNDSDANPGDILSAVLVSDVAHGTLTLNSDGSFTYTHDDSPNLIDGFTYRASDGMAESETAAVILTITPRPPPPPVSDGGGGGGCFIGSLFAF